MTRSTPSPRRAGFTLVELGVVILIIALLMGILIPVLSNARQTAQSVAQQAQLTAISQAAQSYQKTFDAYPGYFSEAQFSSSSPNSVSGIISTNENLVFSLMGGVNRNGEGDEIGSTGVYFDEDAVSSGPSVQSGRTYDAFYSPDSDELVEIEGNIDNDYPELVDVSTGMPILYFRKQGGASQPVTEEPSGGGAYSLAGNAMYLGGTYKAAGGGTEYNDELRDLSLLPGVDEDAANTLAWFAINPKLSQVETDPEESAPSSANNAEDVAKGAFMLMSAGNDGIYVNKEPNAGDPIGNLNDVNKFDDVVVHGGS